MLTLDSGGNIVSVPAIGDSSMNIRPIPVTPFSMLNVPAWFRAMMFLSTNLAGLPRSIRKYGVKDDPNTTPHPLKRLITRKPNQYQNPTKFWQPLFFHAAHRGNGYAVIERRPGDGRPIGLHNVLPEDVTPFRYRPAGTDTFFQFYAIYGTYNRILPGEDVIHLIGCSYDGMAGMDNVILHRRTIQSGSTLDTYREKYLEKGTQIRGAIEIPGYVETPKLEEMKAYVREQFQGATASDEVLFLTDGAKLNNTTISPQESQLVQLQAMTTKQIAQITGIPPQFLYEFSESKYNNNVEAMGIDVVRYTLRPWIEQIEDELTDKLLTVAEVESGLSVVLNPDALLRGDTRTQTSNVVALRNAGVISANEGRDTLGYPESDDPDADKLKSLGDTAPNTDGGDGQENTDKPSTDEEKDGKSGDEA